MSVTNITQTQDRGASASVSALLEMPFTPAMASCAGMGRAALERMLRNGEVVRIFRGVYFGADRLFTREVREQAIGFVLGRRQVVVGRTAAWLHGCSTESVRLGTDPAHGIPWEARPAADVEHTVCLGGLRVATAAEVAVDLATRMPPAIGQALTDSLLRSGAVQAREWHGRDDLSKKAMEVLARADGRSRSAAESVARHHWLNARLPTPMLGLAVEGTRMALALPWQRFGVLVTEQRPVEPAGWTLAALAPARVLSATPIFVRQHLEREFHQHLLRHGT